MLMAVDLWTCPTSAPREHLGLLVSFVQLVYVDPALSQSAALSQQLLASVVEGGC